MSLLLSGVNTQRPRVVNDESLQEPTQQFNRMAMELSFAGQMWPRSHLQGADGANIAGIWDCLAQMWEIPAKYPGNDSKRQITGICIDVNGNPVSGATVKIFDAATKALVCTSTSASDGTYHGSTPFGSNQVYAVAYLAGSPDIVGVTVRTL